MPKARPALFPLWARVAFAVFVVGVPSWLALQHHDRIVNQRRLAAIASVIAGRPVQVHCPGVLGRLFAWDIVEGSVQFDASGRPGDVADLRARACAELDAIAEGRRARVLACVADRGVLCGPDAEAAAMAVDVVTHESFHLAGFLDEAQTECHALQTMAWTAQRLGATPEQARALARVQVATNYPKMPDRYRLPGCTLVASARAQPRSSPDRSGSIDRL